jgi:hypothetical protein
MRIIRLAKLNRVCMHWSTEVQFSRGKLCAYEHQYIGYFRHNNLMWYKTYLVAQISILIYRNFVHEK